MPERARGAEGAGGGGDAGGAGGGAGGAGRMVPAGGVPQLGGPVSGYNVQPISRSQARAAVARAQQMAAGSPQTTGEDLERINREANARAREHHEAQQLAARQSGRISHGPMIPSYGTHPSPHGHGHEYVG
ncbi:hypothetical protein ISS30_07525 [bacterium]|nr:hypothetical protein [bacterium]